jgi:anti-sigma factor RsiW
MNCPIETRESAELLSAYVSGKLEAGRASQFEEHMRSCAPCRQAAAEQRAMWHALDAWRAPAVSSDFDRLLLQRIREEGGWWDAALRHFRALLGSRGLPIAATACVILLAGLLLRHPGSPPPAIAPQAAQVEAVAPEQAESALVDMEMIREFSALVRSDGSQPRM